MVKDVPPLVKKCLSLSCDTQDAGISSQGFSGTSGPQGFRAVSFSDGTLGQEGDFISLERRWGRRQHAHLRKGDCWMLCLSLNSYVSDYTGSHGHTHFSWENYVKELKILLLWWKTDLRDKCNLWKTLL